MGSFAKNVLKLTLGNIAAQVISIAAVPIITRIYSPEDYGIFAIYLSITTILLQVSTLHFHRAMMLPDKRNDAANLLGLSFLSVMGFFILVAVGTVFISLLGFLPEAWLLKGVVGYLWLVPLGVLIQGSALSINFWAIRHKMFHSVAVSRVAESITDRALVLALGFLTHPGAIGLIGGRIVGPFAAICYLVRRTLSHDIKVLWRSLSFAEMARLAHRYKEFPFFSTFAFLVNKISKETPLLLLALLFPPEVAGFYGLAGRVIRIPMQLIGDAISKVFFQRVTGAVVKGEVLARDTTRLFGYMIYLSLPPILILLFFGQELFSLAFGSEWSEAGAYAQILTLAFISIFLYRPLSILFDAYERQKQRLVFDSFLLLVRGAAVVGGAYIGSYSVHITLLTLAVITFMAYACGFVYLFGFVGISSSKVLGLFISKIAVMAPLIIGLLLSDFLLTENHLTSLMVLASSLMLQPFVILLFEPLLRKEILRFLLGFRYNKMTE